jgi:ADP-heptose:LPS heptosyltransferase
MDNVLFIQLSRMGDCIQSTPLLATWRKRFPDDRLVVLVRAENAAIFERNPDVTETIVYSPPIPALCNEAIDPIQRLTELQAWIGVLKTSHFRAVVNLTHDELSCWITTALDPKETRGLYIDRAGRMRTGDPWGLYAFSLLKFRKANLFNIVDSYAHLSGSASTVSVPVFPLDPESVRIANDWVSPGEPGCPIIGFQPGASLAERRWPEENFIAVGRRLAAEGARILVFGSKAEERLAGTIVQEVPGAISFAGKTTLPLLAALLARCTALISNDTGTMHLGAAAGTRILALFESSAYFRETGPYGTGHWVIQSPHLLDYGQKTTNELAGIRRIPPEEVLWAIHTLLDEIQADTSNFPAELPAQIQALHFRSIWANGHLMFYPAQPPPLDSEIICSHLQNPVWLATLDGKEISTEETAAGVFEFLRRYYIAPPDADLRRLIAGVQQEVNESLAALKQMKQILQSSLEKLRRNPKHLVPQDRLAELTRMEERILQRESLSSMNGFIGYFEIGLAMAGGSTTREYLERYLFPVSLLERQLNLFGRLLSACP